MTNSFICSVNSIFINNLLLYFYFFSHNIDYGDIMKKLCLFLLIFFPWYIGSFLFPINLSYYQQLELPIRISPLGYFGLWTSMYLILSFLSVRIISQVGYRYSKDYLRSVLFNYSVHQLFLYFFFTMKSPFLGFTDSMILFISTLILYYETKEINPRWKYFLIPYLLLTVCSSILLLITLFMNL